MLSPKPGWTWARAVRMAGMDWHRQESPVSSLHARNRVRSEFSGADLSELVLRLLPTRWTLVFAFGSCRWPLCFRTGISRTDPWLASDYRTYHDPLRFAS